MKMPRYICVKEADDVNVIGQVILAGFRLYWTPKLSDSNKYPESMFLNQSEKSNIYPCKPHFSFSYMTQEFMF